MNVGFHRMRQKDCRNWGVPGLWHFVEESCSEVQSVAVPMGSLTSLLGPFQLLSKMNASVNQRLSSGSCFLGEL